MRIISILTAVMVLGALYLFMMEREAVIDFAEGDRSALTRIAPVEHALRLTGLAPEALESDAETPMSEQPQAESGAVTDETPDQIEDTETADPEAEQRPGVAVVALHSQARQIDRAVILRGRTEATRQVEIRAETSGRVISEPLDKGSFVEDGDILCQLAPGTRRASLEEARARLLEAEINARAAEQLSLDGFASQTRAAGAQAALQSAQAAVAAAEEELERLSIRAPFAGLMETDSAELGELLQPGALCATVIRLDPIRLVGFVPETDVDKIENGAPAGARLTSGREIVGQVSFVARSADPATRTFRVEVSVDNPDLTIRDGQTAEIAIAASGTDAHLVPGSALTLDDGGRLGLRTVDEDSRARFVPVEVVRDTREGMWVIGLPERADLIVVGQEFVIDGVRVEPRFRAPLDSQSEPENPLDALEEGESEVSAPSPDLEVTQ